MQRRTDYSRIAKLDGTNYLTWKMVVSVALRADGYWSIVDGTYMRPDEVTGPAEAAAWDRKDVEAMAIILPTLDTRQLIHVVHCQTSCEVWDKLESLNADYSILNKQQMLAKFLNYQIAPNQRLVDAYMDLEGIWRALLEIGVTMDESTVVTKIVNSLPEKHDALRKAWDSVAEESQTMVALMARLKKEDLEYVDPQESEEPWTSKAFFADVMEPLTELDITVEKKPRNVSRHSKGSMGQEGSTVSSGWISDSGATGHICGDLKPFITFKTYDAPRKVVLTNRTFVYALGEGTVSMQAAIGSDWKLFNLEDVVFIPGSVNLLSEFKMAEAGYIIVRNKKGVRYYRDQKIGPTAEQKGGLYVLNVRSINFEAKDGSKATQVLWKNAI